LVSKSDSVIALFDTNTHELKVLDNLPEDFIPGQLTWDNSKGLVVNAYYTKPYKLGLIYCPIRKSELFYYDLEDNKFSKFFTIEFYHKFFYSILQFN
jgi:acylaminoacyl-peptidase